MSFKNNFIRETLKKPNILSYVRDCNGYYKGVVISLGKNKIGWSLVSPEDHSYHAKLPQAIPAIAHQLQRGKDWNNIVPSALYRRLALNNFIVAIPKFSKEEGVIKAIGRALSHKVEVIPRDEDLLIALECITFKAQLHFEEKK